jgi:hypothetical protein
MTTLGIIALVLGLASLIAGIVSYARNRAAPRFDEEMPRAVQADLDLFRIDDEAIETGMRYPPAAEVRDAGQAAPPMWATNSAEPKG